MSLLSDRAFMQHFELSKFEAKQQLNSAVDAMYDKMMDELKQWICDRDQIRIAEKNKCAETSCKHSQTQTTIKMKSIVIKHEVCDCAECAHVDECRALEQMTKLNDGLVTKSTGREMLDQVIREVEDEIELSAHGGGTHGRDNEPKRRVVDQMDNQNIQNDQIGTQMNSQIEIFQNVAQPANCQQIPQPKPVTQPQNNLILEQMWNNNGIDDDEEQYDQELLDEVKREIEEEIEIAALNKQGQVELVGQNYHELVNPITNETDPIGTQVNNNSHMNFIVHNETQFQSDQMINETTNGTNQKRPVRLALRSPPPIVPGLIYGQYILDYKP